MDQLIARLQAQLPMLENLPLGTPENLINWGIQAAIFAAILLAAPIVSGIVGRWFNRLMRVLSRFPLIEQSPAAENDFLGLKKTILPLSGWLLGLLAIRTVPGVSIPDVEIGTILLKWLVPFLLLWTLYRLAYGVLNIVASDERAKGWTNSFVRPVIIFLALIQAANATTSFFEKELPLTPDAEMTVGRLITGLAIVALAFMLSKTARRYLEGSFLPRSGMDKGLQSVVATFTAYLLLVAGFISGVSVMGVPLTSLTIVAGGLSVGFGFGMQEIISNFLSGLILMFERSIAPGDLIEVGDRHGRVESLGLRSTRIRTASGIELIVPNSQLMTSVLTNYAKGERDKLRLGIQVFVHNDLDPSAVRAAMLAAAGASDRVLKDPEPRVSFDGFLEDELNDFGLKAWIDLPAQKDDIASELRYRIWEELESRGLTTPIPEQTLYVQPQSSGLLDGADQMDVDEPAAGD